MTTDINKLRELIRTGEFLERNFWDTKIKSKWIFDLKSFISSLPSKQREMVKTHVWFLKWSSKDRSQFDAVMGFLRSLYNSDTSSNKPISANSQPVFIIHGRDDSLIAEVKDCVEESGLKPIVLREQANNGQAIMEKFEDWLGNCKCAIVLYTPCDTGKAVTEEAPEKRARQNVIFEHGLFQGYLGKKRILVLRKSNTILPGEHDGIMHVSTDSSDWKENLKNNIKAIDHGKVAVNA